MLEELLERFDRFRLEGPIARFRTNKHARSGQLFVTLH